MVLAEWASESDRYSFDGPLIGLVNARAHPWEVERMRAAPCELCRLTHDRPTYSRFWSCVTWHVRVSTVGLMGGAVN